MKISSFAEQIGFTKLNNAYYLEKNGFYYYLKEYESFIKINSFYVMVNEEINKEHLKEFTKAAFDNVCYLASKESSNDTLIITLPTSLKVDEAFINSCTNIINAITKKLKDLNYTPKNRCIHCHKEAEYNTFNNEYLPLHLECKEEIKKEYQLKIEKESKEKYRYLLNFLYSIFIGGVMCVINYLLTFNFDVIITPLLLLVTFGSFFGLHLSNAKNDKISYVLSLLISLNFVILFNILAFNHLSNINNQTFKEYFNENTWFVIRKSLFSLLFVFAGFRLYKMFFSKKHPNFVELMKNI